MPAQVAVVTGAGSGIGRAVALGLSGAGYVVVAAGRREAPLQSLRAQAAGEVLAVPTDVTDEAAVEHLFGAAVRAHGRVDLLFNNAGVAAAAAPIDELPVQDWRRVIDTNLTGAFLCARAAFARMRRQDPAGGRIINNGSIASMTPRPDMVAYTASKHGISGLTRSLALEGRRFGIACGQIDIGNVRTDLGPPMAEGTLQADYSVKPEPTFDVAHVVEAVLYMAALPPGANVLNLTVMATAMPFVGRG